MYKKYPGTTLTVPLAVEFVIKQWKVIGMGKIDPEFEKRINQMLNVPSMGLLDGAIN